MRWLPFLFLLLFSCGEKKENTPVEFHGTAMTMAYKVKVGTPITEKEQQKISQLIQETFSEVDRTYNKWNPESELSNLNHAPGGVALSLTPQLFKLLQTSDHIVKLSDHLFDPTIEPLQNVWKSHLEQGKVPSQETLAEIIPVTGWHHIHFQEGKFYKEHDQTELDLGGIAKGLAVDLLVERLHESGYRDLYVEWGGEIKATGEHPDHRPWTIFISRYGDPDPDHAIAVLPLRDQAIATSGNYFQNWTVGSDTYSHILNPKTHMPLIATQEGVASASVVAPSCAIADALATAAMLFPTLKDAQEWAKKIEDKEPSIKFYLAD